MLQSEKGYVARWSTKWSIGVWRWEKTQEGGVELCFQKLLLLT